MRGFLLFTLITVHSSMIAQNNIFDYLRTFGRGAVIGFAQGTTNGTCKQESFWQKHEMSIRSGTWFAALSIETTLHWKQKDYPIKQVAAGFLGLGVGQVAGEMLTALRDPDHSTLNRTDVFNAHFACAALCALYSVLIERNKLNHNKPKVQQ